MDWARRGVLPFNCLETEIKVPGFVLMLNRDRNNSARRCACISGTSLRVFSAGRISLTLIGCSACVGGSVDFSDWPRSG